MLAWLCDHPDEHCEIDVMITDVCMAGMSGLKLGSIVGYRVLSLKIV